MRALSQNDYDPSKKDFQKDLQTEKNCSKMSVRIWVSEKVTHLQLKRYTVTFMFVEDLECR